MAIIDTTEIKFDRLTKDFAVYVSGRIVAYGRNYHEAEVKRMAYLAAAHNHTCATCGGEGDCPDCDTLDTNACGGFGCVDGCGDCVQVAA